MQDKEVGTVLSLWLKLNFWDNPTPFVPPLPDQKYGCLMPFYLNVNSQKLMPCLAK